MQSSHSTSELCSVCYTSLQMKSSMKSAFAINPVSMEIMTECIPVPQLLFTETQGGYFSIQYVPSFIQHYK